MFKETEIENFYSSIEKAFQDIFPNNKVGIYDGNDLEDDDYYCIEAITDEKLIPYQRDEFWSKFYISLDKEVDLHVVLDEACIGDQKVKTIIDEYTKSSTNNLWEISCVEGLLLHMCFNYDNFETFKINVKKALAELSNQDIVKAITEINKYIY